MYSLIDIFKNSCILRDNHILERIYIHPRKIGISRRKEKMRRNLTEKTALLVLLCMAVMLLAGCGAAAEEPQPTPTATLEPTPVPTPKPTPTPTPEPETTLKSMRDPIAGLWSSTIIYDLKGNPLEAAVDLMTLIVSQDGTILLSMNGELKTATITYYKSTDDADYYKFGDSGDIICSYTYDNDLVYLAITPNDVMIQFMRAD